MRQEPDKNKTNGSKDDRVYYQNLIFTLSTGKKVVATVPAFCDTGDDLRVTQVQVTRPIPLGEGWSFLDVAPVPYEYTKHNPDDKDGAEKGEQPVTDGKRKTASTPMVHLQPIRLHPSYRWKWRSEKARLSQIPSDVCGVCVDGYICVQAPSKISVLDLVYVCSEFGEDLYKRSLYYVQSRGLFYYVGSPCERANKWVLGIYEP